MRIARIARVADHSERGHTGVNLDPLFGEGLERPQGPAVDRPLRRAEHGDAIDACRGEHADALAEVLSKRLRPEVVRPLMAIAVRSNVVSRGADRLDEMRIPLRDPADDEKG